MVLLVLHDERQAGVCLFLKGKFVAIIVLLGARSTAGRIRTCVLRTTGPFQRTIHDNNDCLSSLC